MLILWIQFKIQCLVDSVKIMVACLCSAYIAEYDKRSLYTDVPIQKHKLIWFKAVYLFPLDYCNSYFKLLAEKALVASVLSQNCGTPALHLLVPWFCFFWHTF